LGEYKIAAVKFIERAGERLLENPCDDSSILAESTDFEKDRDEVYTHTGYFPWICLLGVAGAEIVTGYYNIHLGLIFHFLVLIAILCRAVFSLYRLGLGITEEGAPYHFYLSMALAPLIRILSLALPLKAIPLQYWYLFVGVPVLIAAWLLNKKTGFSRRDLYLRLGKGGVWPGVALQPAVGLTGFLLGFMEFYVIQQPQMNTPAWGDKLLLAALLLLFAGFAEELIFRGIIRKAADDFLGKELSVVYVSLAFASMYISYLSFVYLFFVFGTAVLFTLIAHRTESLLGVALAHGLTAVTFLIIAPQLLI